MSTNLHVQLYVCIIYVVRNAYSNTDNMLTDNSFEFSISFMHKNTDILKTVTNFYISAMHTFLIFSVYY